jgi:hypothetical protein
MERINTMRNAITYSAFYGWVLMAVYGNAQEIPTETIAWQRVPATLSRAPQQVVSMVARPVSSPAGVVQPAMTWQPVSQPVMASMPVMSQGQMMRPAYAGTAPVMMAWQPVMQPGAMAMQPMGQWQVMSPAGAPAAAFPNAQWQPVSQPATTALQPAVYWQPMRAANQVPQLGGQRMTASSAVRIIPCAGTQPTTVDPYARTVAPGYSTNLRYRPIVSLGSVPENYQMGQGMLGQPKVYVPGQPLRNFVRYLTP